MATVHNMDEHTLAKVREVAESSKLRFMMDLEFVEGLANPRYLNFLAVEQNFTKPSFLNYIRYLQYFKDPEYVTYIQNPHALFFLEQLMSEDFRSRLKDGMFIDYLIKQQECHWKHFRANRYREAEAERARLNYQRTVEGLETAIYNQDSELASGTANAGGDDESSIEQDSKRQRTS